MTEGELTIFASSPGVQRGFCRQCGTSLTYAGDGWDTIGVTTATLDDPGIATLTSNVYLEHRQPWVALDKNLKKYERFPD